MGGSIMNDVRSPAFRTAMGGFNKKDVTEYISRLCREYDDKIAELDEKINALTSELEKCREELSEKDSKLAELTDSKAQEEADKISEEAERANNLIAAQNEQITVQKEETESLRAELEAAKAKLSDYASLESKLEQYESMTNRMGEIFMEATADAERIKNEAKLSSEAMLSKTEAECRSRRVDAELQLKKLTETRKNELTRLVDETQLEINRVLVGFSERTRALSSDTINEKLEGFEAAFTSEEAK